MTDETAPEFDPAVVALQAQLLAMEAHANEIGDKTLMSGLATFHADLTEFAKGLGVAIPVEPGGELRSGGAK